MLAAFLRCAFLIGILGWYSINVWKMIDGYFRDQFASYLHEEYRKNPRMRNDVREVNEVDKKDNHVIDGNVLIEKLEELKRAEICTIDKVDSDQNVIETCEESTETLKPIDRPNESVEEKEIVEIISEEREDHHFDLKKFESIKKGPDEVEKNLEKQPKKEKKKKLISKWEEEELEEREKKSTKRGGMKKKKKRVKTITLREKDFLSVKKKQQGGGTVALGRDEDFWEFEEDIGETVGAEKGEEEKVKGIRVADLPFKPKLDIGRLERITADEYCPLTLEDELSCEETTEWSLK